MYNCVVVSMCSIQSEPLNLYKFVPPYTKLHFGRHKTFPKSTNR